MLSLVHNANALEAEVIGQARLHPGQCALMLSRAPITLVLAGIRGGKTHGGALKTLLYAMEHPCAEDEHHLVCSPTYQMSKVPVEKIFKLLYDKTIFPICPLIKYIRSERTFILAADGGITRITIRSLHDPDRIRGMKALSAWLDEAAYITQYAWEIVLGRLADVAGPCWITTTPAGYNWVHDVYEQAVREQRDRVPLAERQVKVVHFSSLANVFNKEEGFNRLVARYDARTYEQEVEAKFIKGRGLVYHPFSRKRNVRSGLRLNPNLPLWVGQDFNVDPMASVLAQPYTNPDGKDGAQVVMERKERDSDTYKLVDWLDKLLQASGMKKSQVIIYPDASGTQRSTSGKSDFRILRAAGYRVEAPARNPLIKDRVNCVNGMLRPRGSQHPRLIVSDQCPELIESLEKQIWKPDSDPPTPDKEHGFDHLNDSLGYMVSRRWPLRESVRLGNRKVA